MDHRHSAFGKLELFI